MKRLFEALLMGGGFYALVASLIEYNFYDQDHGLIFSIVATVSVGIGYLLSDVWKNRNE